MTFSSIDPQLLEYPKKLIMIFETIAINYKSNWYPWECNIKKIKIHLKSSISMKNNSRKRSTLHIFTNNICWKKVIKLCLKKFPFQTKIWKVNLPLKVKDQMIAKQKILWMDWKDQLKLSNQNMINIHILKTRLILTFLVIKALLLWRINLEKIRILKVKEWC